jgi:putative membrane-bound dehydrogenase-like protein
MCCALRVIMRIASKNGLIITAECSSIPLMNSALKTAPLTAVRSLIKRAALLLLFVLPLAASSELLHQAPEGFSIKKVAGSPEINYPMFGALDDQGRLYVAESSGLNLYAEIRALTRRCRISLLEDSNGDGVYDRSHVFADRLVFPMGLAWREGKLYVADPPDLVILEDTTGDGRADQRAVILTGFGHLDNGSLHGLVFGPDGWLYMTIGQPDGYRFTNAAGKVIESKTGALIRCRPDGSHPEVVSRGFENPIEVVFLPAGEIVGTLNWFQFPSGGYRDALVHMVEGGLYPRHPDQGTPQVFTGELLPAIALLPAVSVSGLERYQGAHFPSSMQGNLFSAEFNTRKVVRHELHRHGSTFLSRSFDFVTSKDPDFHPADVLEDGDGTLLVIDTGSWYADHCPTGKIRGSKATGGIYRVSHSAGEPVHDPWGKRVDWKIQPSLLLNLLGDERPSVRRKAMTMLAALGPPALEKLENLLHSSSNWVAIEQAVWTLIAIGSEPAHDLLGELLAKDAGPELLALTARALASIRPGKATPVSPARLEQFADAFEKLLQHPPMQVRLAAAEALAHWGRRESLPFLLEGLAGPLDAFLEHSLVHAIYFLASPGDLQSMLEHSNPKAQKAALVLLSQRPQNELSFEQLVPFLGSPAEDVRATARRIVQQRGAWSAPARELIVQKLNAPALSKDDELLLREWLPAFPQDHGLLELVGQAFSDQDLPRSRRFFTLDLMAALQPRQIPDSWPAALEHALDHEQTRAKALRILEVHPIPKLDQSLLELAHDPLAESRFRLDALRIITARIPHTPGPLFDFLLEQIENADPFLRLKAVEILSKTPLSRNQWARLLPLARSDPLFQTDLVLEAFLQSDASSDLPWIEWLSDKLRSGWAPPPELWEKVLVDIPEPAQSALATLREEQTTAARARLEALTPLLEGGDMTRGRQVFFGPTAACGACHRVGTEGGLAGPDLTRIGAIRSGHDILESILFPNSTQAQGYETYEVLLRDGEELSGILGESNGQSILLRSAGGAERRIHRADIQVLTPSARSLMPEGLERVLSEAELRDLLSFLQELK